MNRVFERSVDRAGHVSHVIASNLTRRVRQAVFEHIGSRQQQQAWCFDGVACHTHHTCFLTLLFAIFVKIHHASDQAFFIVLNTSHMRFGPQVEVACGFSLGDLGVQSGPFGTALATLETKAQLHTTATAIAWLAVDGHIACVYFFVAQFLGTRMHHFEVVVARQTGDAIGACHAHFVFCFSVIRFQLGQGDGPVEQIGTLDITINSFDTKLMLLEAQRRTGPVGGGAAHGFANPSRQS